MNLSTERMVCAKFEALKLFYLPLLLVYVCMRALWYIRFRRNVCCTTAHNIEQIWLKTQTTKSSRRLNRFGEALNTKQNKTRQNTHWNELFSVLFVVHLSSWAYQPTPTPTQPSSGNSSGIQYILTLYHFMEWANGPQIIRRLNRFVLTTNANITDKHLHSLTHTNTNTMQ